MTSNTSAELATSIPSPPQAHTRTVACVDNTILSHDVNSMRDRRPQLLVRRILATVAQPWPLGDSDRFLPGGDYWPDELNGWSTVLAENAASHWLARSTGFELWDSSATSKLAIVLIRIASNYLSSPGCKGKPHIHSQQRLLRNTPHRRPR